MGYTHYWRVSEPGIDAASWDAITRDVSRLFSHLPAHSTSAGGPSSGEPLGLVHSYMRPEAHATVNKSMIAFNGKPFGKDLGNEDFRLERTASHDSCKTARKPYDLAVCAVLMVALRHAPGQVVIDIDDGYARDWQPALDWVTTVLGPGYDLPQVVKDRTAKQERAPLTHSA